MSTSAETRRPATSRQVVHCLRCSREHGRRLAYLDRLHAVGVLPLSLQSDEADEARRILIEVGLPLEHVARIVSLESPV